MGQAPTSTHGLYTGAWLLGHSNKISGLVPIINTLDLRNKHKNSSIVYIIYYTSDSGCLIFGLVVQTGGNSNLYGQGIDSFHSVRLIQLYMFLLNG